MFCFETLQQNQGGATAAQTGAGVYGAAPVADAAEVTRILTLKEAVTLEELASEEEYTEILEDMRDECSKVLSLTTSAMPCVMQPASHT